MPCLLSYEAFGAQKGSRGAISRAWGAVPGQSWGHTGPMCGSSHGGCLESAHPDPFIFLLAGLSTCFVTCCLRSFYCASL